MYAGDKNQTGYATGIVVNSYTDVCVFNFADPPKYAYISKCVFHLVVLLRKF